MSNPIQAVANLIEGRADEFVQRNIDQAVTKTALVAGFGGLTIGLLLGLLLNGLRSAPTPPTTNDDETAA